MLRFDPFRDIDRMTEQLLGVQSGSNRAPRFMPMDLYRQGDRYVLEADLPGIDPASVEVGVEHNTLTIRAERTPNVKDDVQWISSERFTGTYQRQLALGDGVDAERIEADYANGVLTVNIPVAERAKSRRISVNSSDKSRTIEGKAN